MLGLWRDTHAKKSLDRVLIVEDDALLAMAIEEALADAGVQHVTTCATADEALHALDAVDAIVLDVHLADRDDGWALAELVAMLGSPRPRIVFSTGTPEDIPARIAEMGPVFAKPYNPALLVKALMGEPHTGLIARWRGGAG
ncbi:response regulator [Altererythrobacter xixiisoli]|uniref:Response regulator n=1 Tax=Croceibacterium xixiisoli TaxID=1476466 RepID=A0A6I4TPI5_9SPHN|nr:response regulator [Croceibacterium xixiisoli]MXO98015.1 response regulator [Croceibacterium xixiisoli]